MSTVLISGGFCPPHIGHARLIRAASGYGQVIVALNSDAWLMRKKGFVLMPFAEREEMLLAMRFVDKVIAVDDSDGTVQEAIYEVRPTYFANGGDRTEANPEEAKACRRVRTIPLFGIGGGKIQSSSNLIERIKQC